MDVMVADLKCHIGHFALLGQLRFPFVPALVARRKASIIKESYIAMKLLTKPVTSWLRTTFFFAK